MPRSHARAHLRPLALAWFLGLLGMLVQLLVGACTPHPAEPEEVAPPSTVPGGALGERSEQVHPPLALTATDGTRLRLVSLHARAAIEHPLALTELHLVFENAEDRTIEGRFRVELPPRAAISRFAMKIGNTWQEGEVVERQAARVAYEDFLHRRQDPALLEHEAGNSFGARVFPIAAHERKEIIVSFSQELASSAEPYRLALLGLPELESFSAKVIRRDYDGALAQTTTFQSATDHWTPLEDLTIEPHASASGPIALRHGNLVVARLTPDGEDVALPLGQVTVLFDTSASRALGFDTRIHRLGDLVRALVVHQGQDFPLRVIAFDQTTAPIYDGMASGFGQDELETIAAGRALGASDLVGALNTVAEDAEGTDRLIVVTDGILTAGKTEIADIEVIASTLATAGVDRIDAVLDGGTRDDVSLRALTTAALLAPGIVVDADLSVETIANKLSRTTLPASDVIVPGASWVWPQTLEGVQAGDEVLVYADLPAGTPMRVELENHPAMTPIERAVERPLLERAWVRANIERLQARRSALLSHETNERGEIDKTIIALSTEFRVLAELTALLVLESEADYVQYGIGRRALADILTVGENGAALLHRTSRAPPPVTEQLSGYSPPGNDDQDVWGSLVGTEIGEASGVGGLGLVGTGRGGGGDGEGTIGLGNVGLIAGGGGGGAGWGYGRGSGAGFGGRSTHVPRVRMAKAEVKGAIDKDIIRRIVRAHINEIRHCYNQGLVRDVNLRGRFVVQFSITPAGNVASAVVQSSTLRDLTVARCAAKAIRRWKFPKPEGGGNVVVTYPFVLESDRASRPTPTVAPSRPTPQPRQAEPVAPITDGHEAYSGPYAQVKIALAEGRTSDALATTLAWRETDAGDVLALVALGEVAEALGDRATAARAYGSIIDLYPARADLRRYAGARLERLGPAELELAVDTYAKAVASRPDHPSGHRSFAYAAVKAGRHAEAFAALRTALRSPAIRWDRFARVKDIIADDLEIVGAAWLANEPRARDEIASELARHGLRLATTRSTRFVLNWETDANDVDFHIEDAQGGHAYYADRVLPSGGELFADITTGYGPECFAIEGTPSAGPYHLFAHYFSQGPMGFGMGKLQILVHDGHGGLSFDERPFVIMKSGGRVDLGTYAAR